MSKTHNPLETNTINTETSNEIIDYENDPTLTHIIQSKSLKWIFIGGKGGVGKTTTSCSLATLLTTTRKSVLLISTDPAHNISDAFGQNIGKHETQIKGFNNLFAMEIDPKTNLKKMFKDNNNNNQNKNNEKGPFSDLLSAIPGIDEAISFAELMKQVEKMDYDIILFDTAPTGHTLKLLNFPNILEKGISKLISIKNQFSGIFSQFSAIFGPKNGPNPENSEEFILLRLEKLKTVIEKVQIQFKNPDLTTFISVCIPEFLSVYETERLTEKLSEFSIDSHCLVVNQVLFANQNNKCSKCLARMKMQEKYLRMIEDLFEDYNIVTMPLLDEEVRGVEALKMFAKFLVKPYLNNSLELNGN